jgi:peptidyl-prolyl cis-trans isomerase SurA
MYIKFMRKSIFSVALFFCAFSLFAQTNDPVIMTINEKEISKSEFEYSYNKNNNDEVIEKKSLSEYVELFENLKFKVMEAESLGMDTTVAFKTEFEDYRGQLAKQYLNVDEIDDSLIKKEYDRMSEIVELSHIFIAFPSFKALKILPEDTLVQYKKALDINKKLAKGADFSKLADEYSDDKETLKGDRHGYLGWYKALQLVPALEDLAYSTPTGKTSIGRSNFGYHIIKVHAKKSISGSIRVAHIFIRFPEKDSTNTVETQINEAYSRLQKGEDFATLAKEYSTDKENAANGGDLGWITFGEMIPVFQAYAFTLNKVGDYSIPFKSEAGYHIVKLLDEKPIESFDAKREEIKSRLLSGGFFLRLHQPTINRMKTEDGFVRSEGAYKKLFDSAVAIYPSDSAFYKLYEDDEETLFTINNKNYPVSGLVALIKKNPRSTYSLSVDNLDEHIRQYEYNSLLETEDKLLELKYPEFRDLVREYRDAILMFNISSEEVWDKASTDTEGLERFFEANKSLYSFTEPHFKGYVVEVKDAKTKKKIEKEIKKMTPEAAVEFMNENYRIGDVHHVKIQQGLFKKGDNAFVDESAFKTGSAERQEGFQDFFLLGKIIDSPESFTDVRGLVIADYQDFLEKEWLKKLRAKYSVKVNQEVLNTLK